NELLGFGADQRDYGICKPMLAHLGITSLKLLTNNPRKVKALEDFGITVAERIPLRTGLNPFNRNYLATKAGKLGHLLGSIHQAEAECWTPGSTGRRCGATGACSVWPR